MNTQEFLANLLNTHDEVGTPYPAVSEKDAEIRAELNQKYYMVMVSDHGYDSDGNYVSKTGNELFYVYHEGTEQEQAISAERAPKRMLSKTPPVQNTFQQEADNWFSLNKTDDIEIFEVKESSPQTERCQYRCFHVSGGSSWESTQLVYRINGEFKQAAHNG